MIRTVHPARHTRRPSAWQSLLDDPEVLTIIRGEARRLRARAFDPLVRDEAESYFSLQAIQIARRYATLDHHDLRDPKVHWYAFLRGSLRVSVRGIDRDLYGSREQARFVRDTALISEVAERHVGGLDFVPTAPVRGVDSPVTRRPDSIAGRALALVTEYEAIDAATLARELGITLRQARKVFENGVRSGRYCQTPDGLYRAVDATRWSPAPAPTAAPRTHVQQAIRAAGESTDGFTVDDVLANAPSSNHRSVVESLRQAIAKGRVTRIRRSGGGHPAVYALANEAVAA